MAKNDDSKQAAGPAGQQDGGRDDAGQQEVQRRSDEANEKGYIGTVPDETPNENYTVQGVTSGAPTPETERGKNQ